MRDHSVERVCLDGVERPGSYIRGVCSDHYGISKQWKLPAVRREHPGYEPAEHPRSSQVPRLGRPRRVRDSSRTDD